MPSRNRAVRHARGGQDKYRTIIAALLLVIVVLGTVALYYSPLLDGLRERNFDPVQIYAQSSQSVVTVRGVIEDLSNGPPAAIVSILGTGFVIKYGDSFYVVTNFHVVDGLLNSTVTFSNGDAYRARAVGSDAYSDLAIVSVNAPLAEYHPLNLGSSSKLKVGETVVAIGNPFGLSDTITVGVVSQLGRSLDTGISGGFVIADTIQFSAAINPGNSGGPLIDSKGMVVGITSASVTNSQGLGFAIPVDTISRELPFLVKDGRYDKHPYLGVQLVDMNYELSQAMGTNVTWGVLVEGIVAGGPADKSGLIGGTRTITILDQRYLIGGDIITSVNGTRVVDYDDFASYLEQHAVSGQTVQLGIIRQGDSMVISVVLGTRPPLT